MLCDNKVLIGFMKPTSPTLVSSEAQKVENRPISKEQSCQIHPE